MVLGWDVLGQAGCIHSLVHHRFPLGPACRSYGFIIIIFFNLFSACNFSCNYSKDCMACRRVASMGLSVLKKWHALQWVWSCARVVKNTRRDISARQLWSIYAFVHVLYWISSKKKYLKHILNHIRHHCGPTFMVPAVKMF